MGIRYSRASREKCSTYTMLCGASGSGKTFSALRLASGISGGKPFAVLDTEAGRAKHYADQFNFDWAGMSEPFSPSKYLEAAKDAEEAGYAALVIDSFSHAYEGPGGYLRTAEEEKAHGKNDTSKWTKPGVEWQLMIGGMTQRNIHIIYCVRAKWRTFEEFTDENGRKRVVPLPANTPIEERWKPIMKERSEYEFTARVLFMPENPGVIVPLRVNAQHQHCFPAGQQMTEQSGELLAAWARGASAPVDPKMRAWLDGLLSDVGRATTVEALQAIAARASKGMGRLPQVMQDEWSEAVITAIARVNATGAADS